MGATPANASDPLAEVWEKSAFNPVVHVNASVGPGGGGPPGSGGDPSAPWQTPSGEWRIATRDNVSSVIWATMDLESPEWYWVGPQPNFPQGACPSFFPLPKHTPGAGVAPAGAQDPTHVYLWSDTVYPKPKTHRVAAMVGTYTDTGVRAIHSFEATPGIVKGLELQLADNGTYYAAKDFYDPVKDRRILWGWAQINHGAQTMPREVTWHPELQQLVFSPLEEQAKLRRSPSLASLSNVSLSAGAQQSLGDWSPGVGSQSEVSATFAVPAKATTFGIGMLTKNGLPTYEAYVQFTPAGDAATGVSGSWQVGVGVRPAGTSLSRYMNNTDISGGDYNKTHYPSRTDPEVCQAACDADAACVAWTYVIRGEPAGSGDCCLKSAVACASDGRHVCTSGVKTAQPCGSSDLASTTLGLLPSDKTIDIRIFTDNVLAEVYFMNGRVALTVPVQTTDEGDFTVFASEALSVQHVEAWQVSSIWITPD